MDYRLYLKDFYAWKKSIDPEFSYRVFAQQAKLKAGNHLKIVIDGRIHLSPEYRKKFATACELIGKRREYFYLLIEFMKAKKLDKKNSLFKKISKFTKKHLQKEIEDTQYEYLSKWYFAVLRSMLAIEGINTDHHSLAKKLRNYVTPNEVEEAIKVLLKLGLIKKNKDGSYKTSDAHVKTKDEIASTSMQNYHSQMINVGIKSIEKNELKDREIDALTMGISEETAGLLKSKIKNFYTEVVDIISEEKYQQKTRNVWQFNTQFFKLTD